MIWTSRFLFLNPHAMVGIGLSELILAKSVDPVRFTIPDTAPGREGAVRVKGPAQEHLLEAEQFLNRTNGSILDFEKIFVGMRNPYGLELARYLHLLETRADDSCPERNIAINGSFADFLEYAPLYGRLPPRLDRCFEVLGRIPDNLVILRYESLGDDFRHHLAPYLSETEIPFDIPDDRGVIERIYDVETEELCYRRNQWFFDKGYYQRLDTHGKPRSMRVGRTSILFHLSPDVDTATHELSTTATVADGRGVAPAVSIVVLFQDSVDSLWQALASVYRQTFTDWELLLVGTGSSDGSRRMAEELVAADPRVRCIEHDGGDHGGTGVSRNLGYAHARGEFVAKLDSADIYTSPAAIAEQVAIMRAHPQVAMVYGPSELWRSWMQGVDTLQSPSNCDKVVKSPRLVPKLIRRWNDEPYSRLERLSAVRAVGGCEPGFQLQDADFTLWLKLALRFPIYVSSRCWYRLRVHPESRWHGALGQSRPKQEVAQLYQWADDCLKRDEELSPATRVAFRSRLWLSRTALKFLWVNRVGAWVRSLGRRWNYMSRLAGRWSWYRIQVAAQRSWNLLRQKPTGEFSVNPRVIWLDSVPKGQNPAGAVELQWAVRGTEYVDVRVGSPSGSIVVKSGPAEGGIKTGPWVEDCAWFFLQDANAADPDSLKATLNVLQVRVRKRPGRHAQLK